MPLGPGDFGPTGVPIYPDYSVPDRVASDSILAQATSGPSSLDSALAQVLDLYNRAGADAFERAGSAVSRVSGRREPAIVGLGTAILIRTGTTQILRQNLPTEQVNRLWPQQNNLPVNLRTNANDARSATSPLFRTWQVNAVRNPVPTPRPETYVVFVLRDLGGETDTNQWLLGYEAEVAGLLSGLDPTAINAEQLVEVLRNRRSLNRTDLTVLDWDAALVVDLGETPDDVLYVLELANLQLAEWRVLDAILDRHLNRAYDHLGRRPGLLGRYGSATLWELRQLRVDVAKLADQVSNITKFIGDWYLARVYLGAKERFHLDEWRASVDQRLSQLDRLYAVVQSDVNDRRMLWLELLIVALIAVELFVSLVLRK